MIKLLFPLPKKVTVAVSGGVDSMAIVDFLRRKHEVDCAFYHHGTENSKNAFEFVTKYCEKNRILLHVGCALSKEKPKKLSWEEYWRDNRYKFLSNFTSTVITAHHLDDCVETYIWSCMHGKPKLPQFKRDNIRRPFLTTRKSELLKWCDNKKVPWIYDTSNDDTNFTRNYIRHELMPHALKVNPGLYKVVKKTLEQKLIMDALSG